MRSLKFAAIASVSLLLVMACMVGYLFLTAEVQVVEIKAQAAIVTEDTLKEVQRSIEGETLMGTLFQKPLAWKDASEYVQLEYTIRLRNNCLVPIDMIEVQIVPQNTDILQHADLEVRSLNAKSEGELKASILTTKDAHPVREIIITYYVWGVSFTQKTVYGA